MPHSTESPLLTTVQQCVIDALAAGATLTDAAEANNINRATIYRWMKTRKEFSTALHHARAEFVLARRDDLHYLSNRALEILLVILNNPKSSPAVLLRTAMFILQRPQLPKTGWCMPEPAPTPDGEKLIDSAIIEQDYDGLPGLHDIEVETEQDIENNAAAGPGQSPEAPAETPAESPITPPTSPAPECNEMQHDFSNFDRVASAAPTPPPQGLRSCPLPPDVVEARAQEAKYLELLKEIDSLEAATDALEGKRPH
jgi:Helix-turn-helix domain